MTSSKQSENENFEAPGASAGAFPMRGDEGESSRSIPQQSSGMQLNAVTDNLDHCDDETETFVEDINTILERELVPRPENYENKAELKDWDEAWTRALKSKEAETKGVASFVVVHLRYILFMDKHPLHRVFLKTLRMSEKEASAVATKDEHLKEKIRGIVRSTVESLLPAVLKHYALPRSRPFDSWFHEGLCELTHQSLFDVVFSKYTSRFKKEDEIIFAKCKKFSSTTPTHFGVPGRLCLTAAETIPEDTPVAQLPYSSAIIALKGMEKLHSAASKELAVLEAAHHIISVEENNGGQLVDALAPIMLFAVVRSSPRSCFSTMQFIDDFADEGLSEASYYFTCFKVVVQHLLTLTEKDLNMH